MKIIILTLIFFISVNISFGQTYINKKLDKSNKYNYSFRINKDSTINFIYEKNYEGEYGDHTGKIKKINDTLFRVSAIMIVSQFSIKSFNNDTIYIQLESNIARQLDAIEIKYSDNKTREQLQGYDRMGKPIEILKIPVKKKLFNNKKGKNFITITINRKNFLSDNFLSFKIPFGSSASFSSGQKNEFDVVIKNNKLWTVGKPPLQIGHFKVDKKF